MGLCLPPLLAPHPTPVGRHRSPGWAPSVTQPLPPSYLFYTWKCLHVMLLSQFVPPSPFPAVSTSLFSSSVSPFFSCKMINQYYFSRFHIYVLIYWTAHHQVWCFSPCERTCHHSGNSGTKCGNHTCFLYIRRWTLLYSGSLRLLIGSPRVYARNHLLKATLPRVHCLGNCLIWKTWSLLNLVGLS